MSMTEREQDDALVLLQNILEIPTVNGVSDEAVLAKYLQQYFKNHGIESMVQIVDEKRSNLIVDIPGINSDKLMVWNGHLDTVPYGNLNGWETDPSKPTILDDKVYARGASDMKSGLAAMVYLICHMKTEDILPHCNIRFIATCDEESGGTGASKVLQEDYLGVPSVMIIGEPTDCNIGIAQKGCLWLKLQINGKTSHGAYPHEGINAIQFAVEICKELKSFIQKFTHPLLKESTAEITSINGGIAPNMIPDTCEIIMDIRMTPDLGVNKILHKLDEICSKYQEQKEQRLQISYEVLNQRPPVHTTEENEWVVLLKGIVSEQGLSGKMMGINYFTDASIFIENNRDYPVILFGPGCPNMAHKPNEFVKTSQYYKAIEILSNLYNKDNFSA
jgi:succinyl-diaminopimelate desuccinylase